MKNNTIIVNKKEKKKKKKIKKKYHIIMINRIILIVIAAIALIISKAWESTLKIWFDKIIKKNHCSPWTYPIILTFIGVIIILMLECCEVKIEINNEK